jgi:hypothetical protein
MSEIFQIRIIGLKGEQLFSLKSGAMNNRVRAEATQKFEILEVATGKAPKKVFAQRAGDDQIVKVIDELSGEEFDLVIEDFHSTDASLWGANDAGVLQQYQVTGDTQLSQLSLNDGLSAVKFVPSFGTPTSLLAGVGVVGLAASGGSSGDGSANDGGGSTRELVTLELRLVADSGSRDDDDVTNVSVVNIIGLEGGASWQYQIDNGEWIAGSGSSFELTEGTHVYAVRQTDVTGKVSVVSTRTITLDTILPANLELHLAADSGSSNVDDITNVGVVNVEGLEVGVTWEYQTDGGAWVPGNGSSFDLIEGTHTYAVRQTDTAGNVSAVSTRTITQDIGLPANLELRVATDSGSSDVDGITNVGIVNIVGLETGATWQYQIDGGDWLAGSGSGFELTEGAHIYAVKQTDIAGNVSLVSTRTIELDTVLPVNPELHLANDNGSSSVDGITNVSVVNIVGLEAGASWEYQIDGGAWIAGSGSSFDLTEGAHLYAVRQTDVAGNVSGVAPAVSYSLDSHSVVSSGMWPTHQLEALNNTRGSDVRPSVTSLDGGGSYVVTWHGMDSEGDRSIFLQRFDANGGKNGQTIQLEATGKTNGNDDFPRTIAVGGNGAFVTVWRGVDLEGDSSIFVQSLNADGTLNGSATKLEAIGRSNGSDEEPKVIALGNAGAYVVVWQGQDTSVAGDRSIFVQQFDANGTVSGNTYQLEAIGSSTGQDNSPQIVEIDSGGAYVVAWSGQEGGSDEYSIYLQRFSTNGVPNGATVKLEALGVTSGGDWDPKLVALGSSGTYAVTWYGEDTLGNYSVFVQRFNVDGSLNGGISQLQTPFQFAEKMDFFSEIAALGSDGAFVVTWQGLDAQGDYSIFVQQFNADGSIVGRQLIDLEPLGVSNGLDWRPQISSLGADGAYAVTWFGLDDGGDDSVFVQCFNPDGSLRGTQTKLEATGVIDGTDNYPKITSISADGAFVVTWQGIDSDGDSSIFVQQFNADGSRVRDAISLQLVAGQDKWITPNESTVLIEVRYLELAEGDVIQLLDAGSMVGLPHTVTAFDVSAGMVALTINKFDFADVSPSSKEGAHRLTAVVTDLAGNISEETPVGLTITVDSIALAPELSLAADTGGIDGITSVPKVNILGLEPWASWQYEIDNDGVWLSGSGSSFNLTNGTHGYKVRQTDAAGNASNPSASQSFTLDTSPPVAVIVNQITVDDIVNAAEISSAHLISGSKEPGSYVTLTIGGRTHTFFPDNATTWSYTLTALDISAMGEGVQTLTATQTDVAGNTSLLSSHSFTVDTVIPTPVMALVNDTGTSDTDGVTRVNTVNVSNLESGAIWEYQVDNGAWLTGSGSSFSLTNGRHDYRVRQTDVAGNSSVTSSKTMTLDTSAVDVSVIDQNMVQLEPQNKTDGRDERSFIGAVGSDGSYVVTWTGPNNSDFNCIFVQKFNPDGTTAGFPLVEIPAEIYFNTPTPKVNSLTNDGTYVVTWHAQDSSGTDDIIFVQRFNANGTANGSAIRLEPAGVTNGFDQFPEVVNLGNNGAFVVTWQGTDSAGDTSVFVQQFNADGTTTGRNMVQLEAIASGSDGQPKIVAVGSSGAYAVTWVGANANGKQSLYVQKFNADGGITGNTLKSIDIGSLSGDYVNPQIAAIGTDGAFAVASGGRDSRTGNLSVFVRQFDSSGSPITLVQLDNLSVPDGLGWNPTISSIGSNGAYVVSWMGVDNEGDLSIFVQQFNTDGSITGNSVIQLEAVNMMTGDDWRPKVKSVGTDGSYVVVWHGDDSAGSMSIFVQRFNANGTTTGHDTIQLDAKNNASGLDVEPEISAVGTSGAFAVTWTGEDSNGDRSIFVQQFNADGTLRQDKVEIETAAGQDHWIDAQESSVTLTIRYADLAVGDIIQLRDSGVNIDLSHTVTAAEVTAGVVSLVLPKSLLAGGGSNGDHPLTAVITDLAGNVSAETPVALTLKVDATIPSAPTISTIAGDNALNNQEYLTITGMGAPVIISGAKESGASVSLTIDNKTYLLSSNASTSWSYALSPEDVLLKSAMSLSVVQRDAAGNTSAAVTRTVIIDTFAAAPQLQLSADTGTSNSDGLTNTATVNVVGLEVGATWTYQIDGGAWQTGTGASFSLINGRHVYNVQQTDAAGNISDTTLSQKTFELDTLNNLNMSAAIPAVMLEAIGRTNGSDITPQITRLGISGQYAVTWRGVDSASDNSIFVQQFNANGTTTGFAPVQLEATGWTSSSDEDPQITVIDDTGRYVVTWSGWEGAAGDTSIYVQQFNANGTTTGYTPVQLEGIGKTDDLDDRPQICAIGGGQYVVVWSGVDSQSDRSIFVQQFNANGTMTGYNRVQLEATGVSPWYTDTAPQIAAVGRNGQYVVTWRGVDTDGGLGDYSTFVQQFNANGTTAGFSTVKLEPTGVTDREDYFSQITALGSDGAYAVVWVGQDSAYLWNVYVQCFNANGTTQGELIKIEDPRFNFIWEENFKLVSVGTEGAFVVIWEGVALNSSTVDLWVQHFNPDGTRSSQPHQLEVYANVMSPNAKPQIATIGSEGAYVIVWIAEDSSRPVGTGNKSIFVQQFSADGSTTGFNRVKLDGSFPDGFENTPQITAVGNDGGYVVTWSGRDVDGDSSIFVQQFNADGTTRKSLVDVQTAAGQDELIPWSENSVTLEVSYSGLSEGQVIEFFESGVSLGVTHTVSAADVSSGRASVVMQKDDLGGSREYMLSVKVADMAGNFSVESPVAIAVTVDRPAPVIGLGAGMGQLINGVQVEGKWFYTWDKNADGNLSSSNDLVTLDDLAMTFLGGGKSGLDFTSADRTFTINGVNLALPTLGITPPPAIPTQMNGTVWSASDFRSSSNPDSNLIYDDLLAVWDAFNGTSSGQNDQGTPPGWDADLAYWTANAASGPNQYVANMHGLVDINAHVSQNFAIFQVL